MSTPSHCLECNAPLTAADAGGLCPKCLLKLGLASQLASGTLPATAPGLTSDGAVLEPFDFGGYRILRLLGKGGMGAVYEAEHEASGRRVALKVLGHALDTPEMRARFLREGQLAAGVRHANVVGVLAAEEIEGAPVIAMELLHDGTLRDRVNARGPLPPAEAVDAVLQIIGGLEAAHAVGVLHRDVKPANCFTAADGTVKVGDFGLSISTLAKAEHSLTQSGAVLGTPAFAAPEQLRGQDIDARADIYAVGATLYFLLTGKPTHEADSLVALIAAVLEKKPADVRTLRPDVPRGLARAVMRCLEKDPARRFKDYAGLRAAIEPFSSTAPTPATLGLRFVAGVVDTCIIFIPEMLATSVLGDVPQDHWLTTRTLPSFAWWLGEMATFSAYYGLQEGLWGTTIGKALCGLRIAGRYGEPPTVGAGLARALIFNVCLILPPLLVLAFVSAAEYRQVVASAAWHWISTLEVALFLGLFVTMRRRNGFAALQDLWTGTRVVASSSSERPEFAHSGPQLLVAPAGSPKLGAFTVLTKSGGLIEALDENLQRRVWIVPQAEGAPALSRARREAGRSSRLRWLQGSRTADENWDAFEAPAGQPLAALCDGRQPWSRVRAWLHDLAEEFSAGLRDGTLPPTAGLDRVWITTEDRAVLLDFPCPGTSATEAETIHDAAGIQRFLARIARAALPTSQPLSARKLIQTLAAQRLEAPELVAGNLRAALREPATVTVRRRLFTLLLGPLAALMFALIVSALVTLENRRFDHWWQQHYAGLPSLRRALELRTEMELTDDLYAEAPNDQAAPAAPSNSEGDPELVRAMNTHLAGRFASIAEDAFWAKPDVQRCFWPRTASLQTFLQAAIVHHPAVTAEALSAAEARLAAKFVQWEKEDQHLGRQLVIGIFFGFVGLGACVSLGWAILTGTPCGLRLFGLALVRFDGQPASRLRAAWRTMAAWFPISAICVVLVLYASDIMTAHASLLAACVLLPIQLAALIHAVRFPTRSLADRLAGTTIVPR